MLKLPAHGSELGCHFIGQIMQNTRVGFLMLDEDFNVVVCNQIIQENWGLLPKQIQGKSLFDLEFSYRPVDLKYRIQQAIATGEPLVVENAEYWITKDEQLYLRLEISPMSYGTTVFVEDVTEQYGLRKELQIISEEMEIANVGLLSTKEGLESANRQLQSMNEELQATNEDLTARIAELNALLPHYEMV